MESIVVSNTQGPESGSLERKVETHFLERQVADLRNYVAGLPAVVRETRLIESDTCLH